MTRSWQARVGPLIAGARRRGALAGAALLATAVAGCGGAGPWFVDVTADAGIDFRYHTRGDRMLMPEINGGGVAVFDYDRDGDLDIYATNGNDRLPDTAPDPNHTDRLLRREADGRYTDVTAASGLGDPYFSMGVAIGDVDNDGDEDLLVTNYGPDRLYSNRGDGTFVDATAASGIDSPGWSSAAVFFDYDRDGWLDLFIGQYVRYNPDKGCTTPAGAPDFCGPSAFPDQPSRLYHNEGGGRFRDVTAAAGIDAVAFSALGVVADDLDDDGWIDLYVANDGDPNTLWHNQRDGTFVDAATTWGAAVNLSGEPEASMGLVADDLDADGRTDLFMTHLFEEKNTFYRALGPGLGFRDDSAAAGFAARRVWTGFGAVAADVDLDGDLDLAVANGRVRRDQPPVEGASAPPPWDALAEPNGVFLNDGRAGFEALDADRCGFCAPVEVSRGLVAADVDADGDLDLVVANVQSPLRLFENRAPRVGGWLAVRAVDPALRRDALGARVTLRGEGWARRRTVQSGVSYFSAQAPIVHLGLGRLAPPTAIDVRWPDGGEETFAVPCQDCAVVVRRGEGGAP